MNALRKNFVLVFVLVSIFGTSSAFALPEMEDTVEGGLYRVLLYSRVQPVKLNRQRVRVVNEMRVVEEEASEGQSGGTKGEIDFEGYE